jgi:hypothetical protein
VTSFLKQTGGEFPLFRAVIAVSVVDDLVQVQVTGIVPSDEEWTIMASAHRDAVKVLDPNGLTVVKIGGVELTYYNGINLCGLPAVSADRLGGFHWPEAYREAVAFLVEMLDVEVAA